MKKITSAVLANVVPPMVVLAIMLAVWQVLCSSPTASLPSPHLVWQESYDLIAYPFFNNGSQDIGLGWRVLISLQRVAYGFGLAAIAGVVVGAIIGQSVWAMRGLDPIFQVLRTVPPLAWLPLSLAAFQDSNPSAIFVIFITSIWPVIINTAVGVRNIPQDYRNVAKVLRLNQIEFFFKIMLPSAAPTSSPAFASVSACRGWQSLPPKCSPAASASASSSGMRGTPRACPTSSSRLPTSASSASHSTSWWQPSAS
jgi:nitrate/nitrite transport system permease protein